MSNSTPATKLQPNLRALRDRLVSVALTGGGPLRGSARVLAHAQSRLQGRNVLITGASSGIGHALALKLAAAGAQPVLVARSTDKLRELHAEIRAGGGQARVYTADISAPASIDALLRQLERDGVAIDVLVNNAGRSIRRPLAEACERAHDYERTMALNYFGAVRLTLGLLPAMRARKCGQIVNVSSVGVQLSSPLFSAYVASKAALDAFARVAANEIRGDGVAFSTVHMPLVKTPMIAPTAEFAALPALTPEQAAELVLRALITREAEFGTWTGSLVGVAYAIAPDLVERLLNAGHRLLAPAPEPSVAATPAPRQSRAMNLSC